MNFRALWVGIALVILTVCLGAEPATMNWKEIDDALAKGLPKTAIEKLEPIIPAAIAEKNYAVAIRALVQKINLESGLEGGGAEERIARLEATIANQPEPMRPVLQTVLAEWYWQYFQENRWTFAQRTQQVGDVSGGDLRTWDLAHILGEIDHRFSTVLNARETLIKTPISDYRALLDPGSAPDEYRPTLYDFIAHEALRFYQTGEQAGVKAEDAFEIEAKGPIFGSREEFLAWKLDASALASHQGKAVQLYQQLMLAHTHEPAAQADLNLARLVYGGEVAVGLDRTARFTAALEQFVSQHEHEEFASRGLAKLVELATSQSNLVLAHKLAERGWKASPQSIGGRECQAKLKEIESKSISIQSESVWNAPWPALAVHYRNQNKIYFRAVAVDFDALFAKSRWNGRLPIEERRDVLQKTPVLTWSADLPVATDYAEHEDSVPVPTTLRPGFYAIVASAEPDFRDEENWLSLAPVWVSDLALVVRNELAGTVGGFILRARDGFPVQGARVQTWTLDRRGSPREGRELTTDENGHFQTKETDRQIFFVAEKDGQRIASANYTYNFNREDEPRRQTQTVFFLDRAIYRPGQTINYKGITLEGTKGRFQPATKRSVTVVFRDANNQEVAKIDLVTNAYGSFNGTFIAPRDRLLGGMSLAVEDNSGRASFRVEEYKRPKFYVAIKAPAEAPKLDSEVSVVGTATAYTGAAIGGARVAWRVERGISWPGWAWWYGNSGGTSAIAHGTATTNPDGTFTVQFLTQPDRAASSEGEPAFTYHIYADVTDTSGETRSADRMLTAGYTAMRAEIDASEWLTSNTPTNLVLKTTSLDGEPTSAAGELKIYEVEQPAQVHRSVLETGYPRRMAGSPPKDSVENWPLGRSVTTKAFRTETAGNTSVEIPRLPAGFYRAELTTKDRFGKAVTARKTLQVLDPQAPRLALKVPNAFAAPSWSVQPGERFSAIWGTGYSQGRAFVEVSCDGRMLQSYWTTADRTQAMIEQPVTEDMRGGFTVRATFVAENRLYVNERTVDVPWTNKELHLRWESFRSKLEPGAKETWSLRVDGPDAKRASAEMVATLYDASLDQFAANTWPAGFNVFRSEESSLNTVLQNQQVPFQEFQDWNSGAIFVPAWTYRHFPEALIESPNDQVVLSPFEVSSSSDRGYRASETLAGSRVAGNFDMMKKERMPMASRAQLAPAAAPKAIFPESAKTTNSPVDLSQVSARKNLNETAFFFPQLTTDDQGVVRIQFTMPEALTQWKFLGFAHDRELRSGLITDTVVTSKDLMVQPNPPRFVREGDLIEFSVKVSNQSDAEQTGSVQLNFAEASTLRPVDLELENSHPQQTFTIPAKQSRSFAWKINIPEGLDFLTFKAVAASARASDGEEGYLPILSRRILVTESIPISVRGPAAKTFSFDKLISSGSSTTLKNQALTVQMTSQPAWNAVLALPYLMEYPYECSEQLFNRYYANALAAAIADSDPKIRRVFEQWKNTPTLKSPLEKNADLKSVALEETPWVFDAQSESAARQRVGLLFDGNRLSDESARALQKLSERQGGDGLWSWFPGGPSSDYISLYIVTGFGRLRHLDAKVDIAPAERALTGLDEAMERRYVEIQKITHPETYHPSGIDILYLYGRSFFLVDRPIDATHQKALDFFQRQSRKYWVQLESRQNQAQLAIALQRFGDRETPLAIMKSLKERSLRSDEMGRYWRDSRTGWWLWAQAPIETQAMMIEAFDEVTHDAAAVDDCRIWLLQQKRTQNWKTTKATADAVYALLLRGHSLLGEQQVEVELGGKPLVPEKVEAGTGFFEQKFVRGEIQPQMGTIKVTKKDPGLSWGSVTWQYLEDISKVSPAATAEGLTLKKRLFVKTNAAQGQSLVPMQGPVAVGDELVVRIELKVDRDLEFVHLKDQRGSGTEPVSVLSGYRYQDGTGYYESTRDTATHFFFDSLRRGVYVFEYSTRVQLAGHYETGLAEVQCMYAPEFNAHSESIAIDAKR